MPATGRLFVAMAAPAASAGSTTASAPATGNWNESCMVYADTRMGRWNAPGVRAGGQGCSLGRWNAPNEEMAVL